MIILMSKPLSEKKTSNNISDLIYGLLKEDIFNFVLKPGQRFTETDLSERYEASRTPIRQALYRLEQEGFVHVHFRSGWEIRPLEFKDYQELFDLRMILEKEAVKRLCELEHPEQLPALIELKKMWLIAPVDYLTDTKTLVLQSEDFHCALVRAAGNQQIAKIHQEASEKIRIVLSLGAMKEFDIAHAYQDHGAILQCILNKDAEQAIHLAEHHVLESIHEVKNITLQMISAIH
ncbi:MAG: GntR family transcriptional regulator [Acinetobacter sp.]|nr:GntR family transcriptional regulator [Acinetobacter sp.]